MTDIIQEKHDDFEKLLESDSTRITTKETATSEFEKDLRMPLKQSSIIPGIIWCIISGLSYGSMIVTSKLSFDRGMHVSRFVLMNSVILFVISYLYGKCTRGISFNVFKYDFESGVLLFVRSFLSMISKMMQFTAIAYIPLTMSGTISFTFGPVFAGLLAIILIRGNLGLSQFLIIIMSIIGISIITVPQYFKWINLDTEAIDDRLASDIKQYENLYFGLGLAFGSTVLDTIIYFIVKSSEVNIPSSLYPFVYGLVSSIAMGLYVWQRDPINITALLSLYNGVNFTDVRLNNIEFTKDQEALNFAFISCVLGWFALETMIIGFRNTNSPVATYFELIGLAVPVMYDSFINKRQLLSIDALGFGFILCLQIFNAMNKSRASKEQKEKEQLLAEMNSESFISSEVDEYKKVVVEEA